MTPATIVAVLESSSPAKDAALSRALSLAQWHESDLHVVHVRPSNGTTDDANGQALATRVAQVVDASDAAGLNVVSAALSGSPVRAVADYTDRLSADLVVVGTTARRGSSYWSAGSYAAALGKAVQSPTIAVRGGLQQPAAANTLFRNIVVPVDFSEVSLRALAKALVLAQQGAGRLLLLHVLDGFPHETVYSASRAFGVMHELHALVARRNRELQSLIPPDALNWSEIDVTTVSGLAHEAIVAAASERRADLVVLGLPRRSRIEDFVAGSTVHRVLRRSTSPVLLVPGPSTVRLVQPADEPDNRFTSHWSASGAFMHKRAAPAERGPSWQ